MIMPKWNILRHEDFGVEDARVEFAAAPVAYDEIPEMAKKFTALFPSGGAIEKQARVAYKRGFIRGARAEGREMGVFSVETLAAAHDMTVDEFTKYDARRAQR